MKIKIKGKVREIGIDVKVNDDDVSFWFSVDNKSVLKIKQFQWKFRGNVKVVIDDVIIQILWDVYNWMFVDKDKVNLVKVFVVFLFWFEN